MKIDVHMHVNINGITPKRLINYLDKNKIDLCWLLTWEESVKERWPQKNLSVEDVFSTYQLYPERIVPMYAPDPNREDAAESLRHWYDLGIKGCAELKSTTNWKCSNTKKLLTKVAELDIPLLFHMQESDELIAPLEDDGFLNTILVKLMRSNRLYQIPKKIMNNITQYLPALMNWKKERTIVFPGYMLDFASLESTLIDFPKINFIGHGPLFWKHISAYPPIGEPYYPAGPIKKAGILVRLLKAYPNLYVDISGGSGFNALTRDTKFTKNFLIHFCDRILFGTDTCMLEQERFLNSLYLPKKCLSNILGRNALKLIKL